MPARKTTTAPTQRVARPAVAKAAKAAGGRQRALPAAAPAAAAPRTLPDGPEALLRAGLKALGTVRDDVVKHHTKVIERLLGVQRPEACGDKPAPAPLGFGADVYWEKDRTKYDQQGEPPAPGERPAPQQKHGERCGRSRIAPQFGNSVYPLCSAKPQGEC